MALPGNDQRDQGRSLAMRYAGLGLELTGGIVGFLLLGMGVDYWFGIRPVGIVTGAAIGCIGGMYNLIRHAIKLSGETSQRQFSRISQPDEPDGTDSAEHSADDSQG